MRTHKYATVSDILSKLAQSRENSSLQLSESQKKTILPPIDKEELTNKLRANYRSRWRDAGYGNREFAKASILKTRILSNWEISRINLSKRTYEYPKDFKGVKVRYVGGYFEDEARSMEKSMRFLSPKNHKARNLSHGTNKFEHSLIDTRSSTQFMS